MPTDVSRSSLRVFLEDYALLFVAGFFLIAGVAGIALFVFGDQEFARQLLADYGLVGLLLILVLEGAMLLYFAPSEALVPIGIVTISSGTLAGHAAVVLTAVAGATVGQYALFVLAKRGGREWLLEKPWFRIEESRLDRFDAWFDRWGKVAIPVSNALLFTRGMLTVPAGFAEIDNREFILLSAIGSLIFQSWLAAAAIYAVEIDLFGTIAGLF